MSAECKTLDVVCTIITDEDERFLVCRRPLGKSRGGLWEFVGGKVEVGETPENAVVRECREELDIAVEVVERVASTTHEYPDVTVNLTMFRAKLTSGTPRLLEHSEMKWIRLSECDTVEFCPADRELISMLQQT